MFSFKNNQELVNYLKQSGVLRTPLIIKAFEKIDRKDFVPKEFEDEAYGDYPLSIGLGQTISQPWTVAFMLELLQPQLGEKILDIGSGSGLTTSLLAQSVSQKGISNSPARGKARQKRQFPISKEVSMLNDQNKSGKVYAIEIISELCKFGEQNCEKYGFVSGGVVKFFCQDGNKGLEQYSPYDKILVSAALDKKELPRAWKQQLKISGKIVSPIKNSVWIFEKIDLDKWKEVECPGFSFVPLV
jgi:protein-L-isoaspartate(D-aspartate) O-methyltransferase